MGNGMGNGMSPEGAAGLLTLRETCTLLDRSERSVQGDMKAGRLTPACHVKDQRSGQRVPRFARADAEKFRAQLAEGLAAPPRAAVQAYSIPAVARAWRPWLTLKEAAEYSGLPEAWLLGQARNPLPSEGIVDAVRVGGQGTPGGVWRFRRDALNGSGE